MEKATLSEISYGAGKKKLSFYIVGILICLILTIIPFMIVIAQTYPPGLVSFVIFTSAFLQFLTQVICFLRLNAKDEQSRMNVMTFVFTIVILIVVIGGSLWIMWHLDYNMMH